MSVVITLLLLLLRNQWLARGLQQHHNVPHRKKENTRVMNRRNFLLQNILMSGGSFWIPPSAAAASSAISKTIDEQNKNFMDDNNYNNNNVKAFQVIPDGSPNLNPMLAPIKYSSFVERVGLSPNGGTLWLGEHHNSPSDHTIQYEILQQIYSLRNNQKHQPQKPIAIGLEQVQVQFQNVLNEFVSGSKMTTSELRQHVQWDTRWVWSFDLYEPILRYAQMYQIPLIALNVNSEDLVLVERYGLPGLPPHRLREYVIDAPGFASFMKQPQYMDYIDYVIRPSYETHQSMGLLQYSNDGMKLEEEMSFRNFFSGRILWDEAMASQAYKWVSQNPGGLLIGLVGADHVKFFDGIPGRYCRYDETLRGDCISVMLNPTLIDTRPSGTVANTPTAMSSEYPDQITLQLRYNTNQEADCGVLALADYLVIG